MLGPVLFPPAARGKADALPRKARPFGTYLCVAGHHVRLDALPREGPSLGWPVSRRNVRSGSCGAHRCDVLDLSDGKHLGPCARLRALCARVADYTAPLCAGERIPVRGAGMGCWRLPAGNARLHQRELQSVHLFQFLRRQGHESRTMETGSHVCLLCDINFGDGDGLYPFGHGTGTHQALASGQCGHVVCFPR